MSGSRNHLQWIRDRLVNVHGENPNYDYMLKLDEIIAAQKPEGTPTKREVEDMLIEVLTANAARSGTEGYFIGWTDKGRGPDIIGRARLLIQRIQHRRATEK